MGEEDPCPHAGKHVPALPCSCHREHLALTATEDQPSDEARAE